ADDGMGHDIDPKDQQAVFSVQVKRTVADGCPPGGEQEIQENLAQTLAARDASAWRLLVDRELGRVLMLAKRMLNDHQDAEDVTQETFARLWQQAPRWRGEACIGTWLYRVAHNLAMDRLRCRQHAVDNAELSPGEEASLPAPDWESPLARLEQAERRRLLDAAMTRLSVRSRTALILVNVLGLRVAEAAGVMHVSDEAMASLLARSRRQLRLLLTPWHDTLLGG
ncbi:MAG: sigma-70 family RNA polymerase sigma factor, partial [Magnetococcus sp. YQC-5]